MFTEKKLFLVKKSGRTRIENLLPVCDVTSFSMENLTILFAQRP